MRRRTLLILACAIFLASLPLAIGSVGDRLPEFQRCVRSCVGQKCPNQPSDYNSHLPWYLRLTGWTCLGDCQYSCMQRIHGERLESGEMIVQFFGKWPFPRVFGVQEIASVIASLGNLYYHWKGFVGIKRFVSEKYYMRVWYLGSAVVSMNAWLWSIIFHIRDLRWTERMDYFSATAVTCIGVQCMLARVVLGNRPFWLVLCCFILLMYYMGHVWYLASLARFDYSYNMIANVVLGLAMNLGYFVWALHRGLGMGEAFASSRNYRPYLSYCYINFFWINGALLLELYDFPPIFYGYIDAHSLWHFATIPAVYFWYRMVIADCNHEARIAKISK